MSTTLIVPGLGGSGPTHWQSQWEELHSDCRRIKAIDWNFPDKDKWLDSLDACIQDCAGPVLLAGHSLGCALIAHWALHRNTVPILGALMVAPADVDDRITIPAEALCFAPMPLKLLPFPTMVVTSNNDIYISPKRAQVFATAWGADFANIGDRGHINADTHLNGWGEGWDLMQNLANSDQSAGALKA
ncbi:MAG: alpha/beta hydrolase [Rhodospirillaceae bacterium]|nr:MAG: alpha/beta hydrolase [Rhodospirillaceae bacterium]